LGAARRALTQVEVITSVERRRRWSSTLRKIGEDVTEMLEHVPASWKVIQHVREKFSCRSCETIAQTPAPSHRKQNWD
jgi:transposase